jgi:hypothetical protein
MNDDTLKVVRVTKSAKNTPDVDRIADDRIAIGAVNDRNSNSSTRKISEGLLLLLIRPAVFDANRRWQFEIGDSFLHGRNARADVNAVESRGHLDEALQVLASNLGLPWQLVNRGERAESRGPA